MSTRVDHDCTPDCPVCIAVDLLKLANTREMDPKSTSINWKMGLMHIVCALIALLAFNAIVIQGHQSHVATAGGETSITVAEGLDAIEFLSKDISPSSIGLAKRLEVIESLSKKIRFSLTESAHMMAAQEADASATDHANPGSSSSPDISDSPTAASPSKKNPDVPAKPHLTETGYLFLQCALIMIVISMPLPIILSTGANLLKTASH